MRIAIPVWNEKVSPVFDTAVRVLVLEYEDSQEVSRSETFLDGQDLYSRCNRLKALGVDILICGAISKCYYIMLCKSAGIQVIPWVSGPVKEILAAFLDGNLKNAGFLMPGCRWQEVEESKSPSAPAYRRKKREKKRIRQ
jgi:predicted Fe-Mo cluster-binding NifX family protein